MKKSHEIHSDHHKYSKLNSCFSGKYQHQRNFDSQNKAFHNLLSKFIIMKILHAQLYDLIVCTKQVFPLFL